MATTKERPSRLTTTRSFSRYEPSSASSTTPTRGRASTLSHEILSPEIPSPDSRDSPSSSVFEKEEEKEISTPILKDAPSTPASPACLEAFDDLPIELVSLSDRFITSLTTAKIYPTPPSIEKLTDLFQDFYVQADGHIATHIQALSTRRSREASPAPSIASRISNSSKNISILSQQPSREKLGSDKTGSAQQMLTPSEISERRKARRMLEHRRVALEEAVERRVCEGIYPRIFQHKSTLDEIRDEKLRSKTAALSLVGITMKDLGVTFEDSPVQAVAERDADIEKWVLKAREGLLQMNDTCYPLGKLQSLASTHQNIVEMLSNLHNASSSADEILPSLIYTLIKCPPEGINVISNLCFVQRFRSSTKINGEAAYCLTNLEAAITFLENVDLATLRADEAVDSKQHTPAAVQNQETEFPFNKGAARAVTPTVTNLTVVPAKPGSSSENRPKTPVSPSHSRRLSTLFQPSASAIGAASDAVRNSADAGLKNISQAMDNSFKLFFGRLGEQHVKQGPGSTSSGTVIVPKTLDDARRLVSPRPNFDEDGNISEQSSFTEQEDSTIQQTGLGIIDAQPRDRSADSTSSTGRIQALQQPSSHEISDSPPTGSTPLSALDSMRNLGNSLNPLNRFAGVNVMRGFGRSGSASPAIVPSPLSVQDSNRDIRHGSAEKSQLQQNQQPPLTAKIDPPVQRFVDIDDAGELKVSEVQALLKDYQRLAKVVKESRLC